MTIKPVNAQRDVYQLSPLPDPPKMDMQQTMHLVLPGVMSTLAQHLGAMHPDSTTLVGGNGYLCRSRADLPRCPYPDMLIAFGVDRGSVIFTNGYVIDEAGKPPDFVLEVASRSTGRRDYINKRETYANLGVPEYWRFDHSGGRYHDASLAGDRLADSGVYRPMTITAESDGVIWGYSEALGLSVCWIEGQLRFWDRIQKRYLLNPSEQAEELAQTQTELTAERQARANAEARADAERQARANAEARIRLLEEELRRQQNS